MRNYDSLTENAAYPDCHSNFLITSDRSLIRFDEFVLIIRSTSEMAIVGLNFANR